MNRNAPPNPQIFGNAGKEHMEKYGTTVDHFAKIGWKNHKHRCVQRGDAAGPRAARHSLPAARVAESAAELAERCCSVNNPYSQFQQEYSFDEVKDGRKIWEDLTLLQCCPTSDGAACVIVANEAFVRRNKLVRASGLACVSMPAALLTRVPRCWHEAAFARIESQRRAKPSRSWGRRWRPIRTRRTRRARSSWPVRLSLPIIPQLAAP